MEILAGIALLSTIVTIWSALYGIESWRREHQGKRRAELAEETLAAFYEVIDVIRSVRSPMSFSSETSEVVKGDRESEEEYQARKSASIVGIRFNRHAELFSKLRAMKYRFRAMFGDAASQPFDDIRKVENEIQLSARMLAHYWVNKAWRLESQEIEAREKAQKFEKTFWEYSEDDEINLKLEKIKTDIEEVCRGVIDAKGSLFSFLNWKIK